MSWLKWFERVGKRLLVLAIVLLFPRRKKALASGAVRRVLLVRIDARVGEALLTTPLLDALHAHSPRIEVDVLVHPKVARVLEHHPSVHRIIPFHRQRLWTGPLAPGIRTLRSAGYDLVVDCGNWTEPSVTSALVARLAAGARPLLGPSVWPTRLLHSHPVPARADTRSEWKQRLHLLSPLGELKASGLSFRAPRSEGGTEQFLAQLANRPLAVVNPGGRLGWRRIPPSVFAVAARTLLSRGLTPVVTWGPGEEALAEEVLQLAPGALRAPPTGIDGLATLMQRAVLTVCNNTGPMHLSVAVGTPTFALFLRMDLDRWGHDQPPHRMLDLTPEFEAGGAPERRVQEELLSFLEQPGTSRRIR